MRTNCTEQEASALRDAGQRIESALVRLAEARRERAAAGAELGRRYQNLTANVGALDPSDSAAVAALAVEQGQTEVLKLWHAGATRLWAAAFQVRASVSAASGPIREAAQDRSIEESMAGQCHWVPELGRPAELFGGPDNYGRWLTETAQVVLKDIECVAAARRPAILTHDEIRSGILRDKSVVIRRLAPEERMSGFAVT